ncbi:Hsp70 family protein [Cystobacter fuscus]|uniref:Hsp70 family protein n=1 Tax=Cystobacter fuscus TaxID=43 RepID=UPI002B299A42|nr:Hsp70 family protein [Cystobacter fuscus]
MKSFVGIDLGTTNSAICSFDGDSLRLWKSPEQTDVTPSVIYIDKRGNKHVGQKAYNSAPQSPDNAAMLFKRLMGTSTPVHLKAVNLTLTPEECSAEVLKVLFGYLPEEVRNHADTGTVITVPAAFNQMQKDATLQAAEMAGIGKVALMQEPVAAIMAVMRARKSDGVFVVYDLGGGTLDIAVAESIAGRVNLLAHGGIAMCGGRDFDRLLVDEVVKPWLLQHFNLAPGFASDSKYLAFMRAAAWAAEKAKIELSARTEAKIALDEVTARARDQSDNELYLDIPLQREVFDKLIEARVLSSIQAAREALQKAGLTPKDVERIVFVGGPTHYKPLRDKVMGELGITGSTEVNPMTAVTEGAALFAESIDWNSASRGRKSSRGSVSASGPMQVTIHYVARTPDVKAKVALKLASAVLPGTAFQVDCLESGWSSGRLPLKDGASVDVPLAKSGDNAFKVFVFDPSGGPIKLEQNRIVITRAAATVDAIPASHSVGIETLERIGGRATLDWLVRAGDSLPKRGKRIYKAAESLRAGSTGSLNFKLWEGEIEDPLSDNRFIGMLKLAGTDFEEGVIAAGADLVFEYEVSDSGAVSFEVSVSSIGGAFQSGHNFYSRQAGQIDFSAAATQVAEEGQRTRGRIEEISTKVRDPRLEEARQKVESAVSIRPEERDPESTKQALDEVLEARRLLAQIRRNHLKTIRQLDLDEARAFLERALRKHARPSEVITIEALFRTAQRSIDKDEKDFESLLSDLRGRFFEVLWRQDWFVVERFKYAASTPYAYADKARYKALMVAGNQAMQAGDLEKLRAVVQELAGIRFASAGEEQMFDVTNILRS